VPITAPANVENVELQMPAGNIAGIGNTQDNVLTGNASPNLLDGGAGRDQLSGGGGDDTLLGAADDDRLSGGLGQDTLVGGAGKDQFLFDSPIDSGVNVDQILDFARGQDVIGLSVAIFAELGSAGVPLSASDFVSGAGAVAGDASDRVIHDTATGMLYYDADGNGTQHMLPFAQIAPGQALAAADLHQIV
jgi:Ca2+-binding RTX toxin-like protein